MGRKIKYEVKLTGLQKAHIATSLKAGKLSVSEIAEKYGITVDELRSLRNRWAYQKRTGKTRVHKTGGVRIQRRTARKMRARVAPRRKGTTEPSNIISVPVQVNYCPKCGYHLAGAMNGAWSVSVSG